MKSYDLFGTTLLSPDELRDRVAALLGVEFRGHDSYYLGECHRWTERTARAFTSATRSWRSTA